MLTEMQEMLETINMVPTPGDPDHHFAMMMIMHHEGAINMANIELKDGRDATMRKMAHLIIQKQTQDINELKAFLEGHLKGTVNHEFNIKMEMSMENLDQSKALQSINGNVDHDFATIMLSHRQNAMEMADLIIQYGRDPEIVALAREMKDDQEMEIAEFQVWLSQQKIN
jgi:uncharacterized protein (DUF305 family)